jgi:hypothetical protein
LIISPAETFSQFGGGSAGAAVHQQSKQVNGVWFLSCIYEERRIIFSIRLTSFFFLRKKKFPNYAFPTTSRALFLGDAAMFL